MLAAAMVVMTCLLVMAVFSGYKVTLAMHDHILQVDERVKIMEQSFDSKLQKPQNQREGVTPLDYASTTTT